MKILAFTKNWLGDVIFESVAFRVIKDNYPSSHLTCVSPPRCEEILRKNPFVDQVIPFDERREDRSLARKWRFVRRLRKEKYDVTILFHRSFTRALLVFLSGIPKRIGYATKKRRLLLTVPVPERNERCHHIEYFLYLLKEAGFQVRCEAISEFYFSEEDDRRASTFLSNRGLDLSSLVALNPGGNRPNKRWPREHFAKLADLLYEKYRCSFVITGALADDVLASEIIHKSRLAKPVTLCGETSLGELGAVFSRCKVVISGDSGPLHIAAGTGVSVVGLYGPTHPELTGPRGRGKSVVIRAERGNSYSMASISPEMVFQTIAREGLL